MKGCHQKVTRHYLKDININIGKEIPLNPLFEENELIKIQMKWIEVQDGEDHFVDLDTHVDIHKPDGIVPCHIFNCNDVC